MNQHERTRENQQHERSMRCHGALLREYPACRWCGSGYVCWPDKTMFFGLPRPHPYYDKDRVTIEIRRFDAHAHYGREVYPRRCVSCLPSRLMWGSWEAVPAAREPLLFVVMALPDAMMHPRYKWVMREPTDFELLLHGLTIPQPAGKAFDDVGWAPRPVRRRRTTKRKECV